MLEPIIGNDPFVAFVGAGASAIPPSRLPSWIDFNNLLLETLCDRLAEYSRDRQPTEDMLALFRARRDHTRFFAPDFQAQLIEEEVGGDYFRVWQSLVTDVYSPVHAALADLAAAGRLAAIVTTNFDALMETALRARDADFEVFFDQGTFEQLVMRIEDASLRALPVIKIHGTLEIPETVIDTLKQRLVGPPRSLLSILQTLLRRHSWLFLGFSGADFSYNPRYLGILDAAEQAKGFVFLAREGKPVEDGVTGLVEAYGPAKARIVYGDLSTWVSDTFGLPAPDVGPTEAIDEGDVTQRVKSAIRAWADRLGPIAVVNIVHALLKSSGMESDALWLMRKTWRSYRAPADTSGPSYARYNYNYGLALLDKGFISNPIPLAEDMSNLMEWREGADENAYEYLGRGYDSGALLPAGAYLSSVLAYRGEAGRALALAQAVTDEANAWHAKQDLCDIAIASVVIYDIVRLPELYAPVLRQLRQSVQIAQDLGDEPRRAILCAHLGRFLTYTGSVVEADQYIREAETIGQRLDLGPVLLASRAVRGRWLSDSGTSDEEGIRLLQELIEAIHVQDDESVFVKIDPWQPEGELLEIKGRTPLLCRLLLDLNRAAIFTRDVEVMNQTLEELDELTATFFTGFRPHFYSANAQCLLQYGDGDDRTSVVELINAMRDLGGRQGNPWAAEEAARLEQFVLGEP